MNLQFSAADEAFRSDARKWLTDQLNGPFSVVRGRGGPGDEHELFNERSEWERALGEAGWIGIGWPEEFGGRGLSLAQQVIFYEEYARAHGPGLESTRVPLGERDIGHIGVILDADHHREVLWTPLTGGRGLLQVGEVRERRSASRGRREGKADE